MGFEPINSVQKSLLDNHYLNQKSLLLQIPNAHFLPKSSGKLVHESGIPYIHRSPSKEIGLSCLKTSLKS
jgi:hypothetical protein